MLSDKGQDCLGDILQSHLTIEKEFAAPTEGEAGALWDNVPIEEGGRNESAVHDGLAFHPKRSMKMRDPIREIQLFNAAAVGTEYDAVFFMSVGVKKTCPEA